MRIRCFATLLLFLVSVSVSLSVSGAAQPLTEAEVEEAMAVLRADLYEMQDPDTGGWFGVYDKSPKLDDPGHDELLTVTATLALLRSGESPDVEPRLARAVARVVWGAERDEKVVATQVVGTRAEIWPLLPGDEHEARLRRDGERLLRAASAAGTFEDLLTERADAERWNHRTTQYAVAGLSEAQKAGLSVPDRFWKAAAAHFIAVQSASGGWSLGPDTEPNAAATCAGLSVLLTARTEVREFVEAEKPEPKLEEAIDRGLAFLDGELTGDKTVYGGSGYLFFGLEQVAMRTGRRRLGGAEWFQDMGRYIVDRALSKGDSVHGQVVNASWFLTFLARGEVPIAFNKLTFGDATDADERLRRPGRGEPDAAGRPDDVNLLTAWLSDTFENELNWQRVALGEPVEGLLSAPASLLMLDGPWDPDAEQQKQLRRYLDLGGLLVVVPVGRTFARVKPAVERMVETLYPAEGGAEPSRLEQVPDDHPAAGLWRTPRKPTRFHAAGNGARTLVLLAGDDLGRDWQQGRRAEDAMATGANLYLLASGYGELPPRVASGFPLDTGSPTSAGRKKKTDPLPGVVVAVVRCGGLVGREPALWEATRRRLRTAGLAEVEVRSIDAAGFASPPDPAEGEAPGADEADEADGSPGTSGTPGTSGSRGPLAGVDLLHLVGVGEDPPEPALVEAAAAFAGAGGTVLVEALGGTSGFADAAEAALAAALGVAAGPLATDTGPLAADPDRPGTADLSRLIFRPYSIQRFEAGTEPTFRALSLDGRAAVLLTGVDVSLGALGVRQWGVHGYGPADAERVARNLLLHAAAAGIGVQPP